jgi:hypothetical protein
MNRRNLDPRTCSLFFFVVGLVCLWLGIVSGESGHGGHFVFFAIDVVIAYLLVRGSRRKNRDPWDFNDRR